MASQEAEGDRLRVVEPPLEPLRPTRPDHRLWYGLAAAGGLCLGCGAALAGRALDRRLSSVDLAESFLGLPALAAIPESSHRRLAAGPLIAKYPASAAAEAFRSLRTALSLLHLPDDGRCILFTSAVPGEGKSYCSMNYAAALAQRGWRTLLIDGDLRRPRQQQSFAAGGRSRLSRLFNPDLAKPGLSACLRDPESFAKSVQPTSTENLFLLGDAVGTASGGDLLARGGFEEVLRRSLAAYDRVVVDSAPLIAVSDALHLAKHIRTVCLVIHAGKTPRRLVRRSCRLLEEVAQRPPVGVLLNLISSADAANYRSYYDEKAYA
jgi:capsular exopolysaccharide synthesis family protein